MVCSSVGDMLGESVGRSVGPLAVGLYDGGADGASLGSDTTASSIVNFMSLERVEPVSRMVPMPSADRGRRLSKKLGGTTVSMYRFRMPLFSMVVSSSTALSP